MITGGYEEDTILPSLKTFSYMKTQSGEEV